MEEGEFILRIARSTAHYLQVIPSVLDTINSSKHKSTLDWFNLYYDDVDVESALYASDDESYVLFTYFFSCPSSFVTTSV